MKAGDAAAALGVVCLKDYRDCRIAPLGRAWVVCTGLGSGAGEFNRTVGFQAPGDSAHQLLAWRCRIELEAFARLDDVL